MAAASEASGGWARSLASPATAAACHPRPSSAATRTPGCGSWRVRRAPSATACASGHACLAAVAAPARVLGQPWLCAWRPCSVWRLKRSWRHRLRGRPCARYCWPGLPCPGARATALPCRLCGPSARPACAAEPPTPGGSAPHRLQLARRGGTSSAGAAHALKPRPRLARPSLLPAPLAAAATAAASPAASTRRAPSRT